MMVMVMVMVVGDKWTLVIGQSQSIFLLLQFLLLLLWCGCLPLPFPVLLEEQEGVPKHRRLLKALVVDGGLHGDAHGSHPVLVQEHVDRVPELSRVLEPLLPHRNLQPRLHLHHRRIDVEHQKVSHARLYLDSRLLAQLWAAISPPSLVVTVPTAVAVLSSFSLLRIKI